MTVTLTKRFLYHLHLEGKWAIISIKLNNEINQPKTSKYLIHTRSQAKSNDIKVPEIHGTNKGLNPHVKLGKQRPLPTLPTHSLPATSLVQHVDNGLPTYPIPKPRMGSR